MPAMYPCANDFCGGHTDKPFTLCPKCEAQKQRANDKERARLEYERKEHGQKKHGKAEE